MCLDSGRDVTHDENIAKHYTHVCNSLIYAVTGLDILFNFIAWNIAPQLG